MGYALHEKGKNYLGKLANEDTIHSLAMEIEKELLKMIGESYKGKYGFHLERDEEDIYKIMCVYYELEDVENT